MCASDGTERRTFVIAMEDTYLTPEEVAHRLNISVGTVKKLLREGVMPGHKIGNQWRINPQRLQDYLAEQSNEKNSKQDI